MKRNKVVIIILLLFILVLCVTVGLRYYRNHNNYTPVSALNSFVYALNQNDVEQMLEYIEPTEAEIVRLAIKQIDKMTDSKIAATFTKWLPFLTEFTKLDFIPEIELDIVAVSEDGNNAKITIMLDPNERTEYYDIYLIQIEKKWYLQYAWKSSLYEDYVKNTDK